MKRRNIWALALLAGLGVQASAKDNGNLKGFVVDEWGQPISGALVQMAKIPGVKAVTQKDGSFTIQAAQNALLEVTAPDNSAKTVTATEGVMTIVMTKNDLPVNIGYNKLQRMEETTASVATVSGETLGKRTSRDITTAMYGYLPGLTSLQNSGLYANKSTSFYVRGEHSLSTNSPLILVDGIERDATYIVPEEVESVTVLKDAAAVALYGYKGANGVINIVTKRGKYNSREVKFTYDHVINWQARKPKFVDAYTYAKAYNEALGYEGATPKYSDNELNAFRTGTYPYLYPNVDWANETFKNTGATNLYNISFRGGGNNFRYYTMLDLQVDKGFVKNANVNDGYSTQNKYSRANLRTNLDIDISPKTKLQINLLGTLAESGKPGDGTDLWSLIYAMPSAAIPVKTQGGLWGGQTAGTTWDGTKNPVAVAQGAAYTKQHIRSLYADMTLKQDFSSVLPGLGGSLRVAYDNLAAYLEDHSKTFIYGYDYVTAFENNEPSAITKYQGGADSEMGTSANLNTFRRRFNFAGTLDYDRTFGEHSIYTQMRWDYEYQNSAGNGNTFYRQNLSWYLHYGFKNKYLLDFNLVGSASNRLAPGHKWAVAPTVSAGWVLSKESFLKDIPFLDLLKLRASVGIINTDNIPGDDYWDQIYQTGGYYSFGSSYTTLDNGGWEQGQLATFASTHEKGYKYNGGLDIGLFKGLNVSIDGYFERRTDIWVSSAGKYSSVLGQTAPYQNDGIVNSWGLEIGADYTKKIGTVKVNLGGSFSLAKNKVIEKDEAPQLYQNLVTTGFPVSQLFGYEAIGLFKDQADIDNSPAQTFSTVYPGDIKYRDVNGDGKIDTNDKTAIGYNTVCPEIYYSFHLGAEWKGLGFDAMFQGTGHYSAVLNTTAMYHPLLATTSLSQYYYDNRWTPDNQNALFPRLASASSVNNYQTSTWWLRDASFVKLRNVEIYYKFPQELLKRIRIMNNAKLYVRGIDLLCFDHVKESDPESYGATNPLTRSVVVGLQIGF